MKVKIYVTHKKGILDPQGKTVETALLSLGYKNISGVKIEKYIELEIDGKSKEEAEKQVKNIDLRLNNSEIWSYCISRFQL